MSRPSRIALRNTVVRTPRPRGTPPKENIQKTRVVQLLDAWLVNRNALQRIEFEHAVEKLEDTTQEAIHRAEETHLSSPAEAPSAPTVTHNELAEDVHEEEPCEEGEPTERTESHPDPTAQRSRDRVQKQAVVAPSWSDSAQETDEVDGGAPVSEAQAILKNTSRSSAVAKYLADTVIGFCNDPAVSHSEGWQVSMPLHAKVLSGTTLHLSLSQHCCLLRFDTIDEKSRDLIFKEEKSLKTILEEALRPRRDVSISHQ
jgi:hypothetical protein